MVRLSLRGQAARAASENLDRMTQQIEQMEQRIQDLDGHPDSSNALRALRMALRTKQENLARLKARLGTVVAVETGFTVFPVPVARSGDGQSAPPGSALPDPMVAGLSDVSRSTPLAQAGIHLLWSSDAGSLDFPTSMTDSRGESANGYTLPGDSGVFLVHATVEISGVAGPGVDFVAHSDGVRVRLEVLSDPARTLPVQSAIAGRCLGLKPLIVRAFNRDSPSSALPDVALEMEVLEGTGSPVPVSGLTLLTNEEGLGGLLLVPGPGANRVAFRLREHPEAPAVEFRIKGSIPVLDVQQAPPQRPLEQIPGSALPSLIDIRIVDPTGQGRQLVDETVRFELLDELGNRLDPDSDPQRLPGFHPRRAVSGPDGRVTTTVWIPHGALRANYIARTVLEGFAKEDGEDPVADIPFRVLGIQDLLVDPSGQPSLPPEVLVSGSPQIGAAGRELRGELVVKLRKLEDRILFDRMAFVVVGGAGAIQPVSNPAALQPLEDFSLRAALGVGPDATVQAVYLDEAGVAKVRFAPASDDAPSLIAATVVLAGQVAGRKPATVYFAAGSPSLRLMTRLGSEYTETQAGIPNLEPSLVRLTDANPSGSRYIEVDAPGEMAESLEVGGIALQGLRLGVDALDHCLDVQPSDGFLPQLSRQDLVVRRVSDDPESRFYDVFRSSPLVGISVVVTGPIATDDLPHEAARLLRLGVHTKFWLPVFGNPPRLMTSGDVQIDPLTVTGGGSPPNAMAGIDSISIRAHAKNLKEQAAAVDAEGLGTVDAVRMWVGVLRELEHEAGDPRDDILRFTGADDFEAGRPDRQVIHLFEVPVGENPPQFFPFRQLSHENDAESVSDLLYSGEVGRVRPSGEAFVASDEALSSLQRAGDARLGLGDRDLVLPKIVDPAIPVELGEVLYAPPGLYKAFVLVCFLDDLGGGRFRVLRALFQDQGFALKQVVYLDYTSDRTNQGHFRLDGPAPPLNPGNGPDFAEDLQLLGLLQLSGAIRAHVELLVERAYLGTEDPVGLEIVTGKPPADAHRRRATVVEIGGPANTDSSPEDVFGLSSIDPFNLASGPEAAGVVALDGVKVRGVFTRSYTDVNTAIGDVRNVLTSATAGFQTFARNRVTPVEAFGARIELGRLIQGDIDSLDDIAAGRRRDSVRVLLILSRWVAFTVAHEMGHCFGLVANEDLIESATRDLVPPLADTSLPFAETGSAGHHTEIEGPDIMSEGQAFPRDDLVDELTGDAKQEAVLRILPKGREVFTSRNLEYLRRAVPRARR